METHDFAGEIKARLTMPDVLYKYGFHPPKYGRMACPLHNGRDKNFSFKDRSFKCFVCNKSGTVIDFAMELLGTDFKGAVARLNEDFGLGLTYQKPSQETASKWLAERQAKLDAERAEQEKYQQLAAEHRYWHEVSVVFAPSRPETYGTAYIHPLYAEAVKRLEYLEYLTDEKIMTRR